MRTPLNGIGFQALLFAILAVCAGCGSNKYCDEYSQLVHHTYNMEERLKGHGIFRKPYSPGPTPQQTDYLLTSDPKGRIMYSAPFPSDESYWLIDPSIYLSRRYSAKMIRREFRNNHGNTFKAYFQKVLWWMYDPETLRLKDNFGRYRSFVFKSAREETSGKWEVKFNIYHPYCFQVFPVEEE